MLCNYYDEEPENEVNEEPIEVEATKVERDSTNTTTSNSPAQYKLVAGLLGIIINFNWMDCLWNRSCCSCCMGIN